MCSFEIISGKRASLAVSEEVGSALAQTWLETWNHERVVWNVVKRRHGGHVGVPKQRNCSHVGFPTKPPGIELMQMFSFILVENYAHWSREFCFLNTDHVMLLGEFSFVFAELLRTSARAENEISKKLFPGVSSRGLYWENKMYKLKRSIALQSLQPLAVGSAGALLSKVPKVFGRVLGENSLCFFKTKASRDTKLCSYFCFYSLYNTWKDQLYRISKSEFNERLLGAENSSDFRETGPWSDAILLYPVRRSIGIWWK